LRIQREFGVRTKKLHDSEVKKKYLLVYEGEQTELQYFEGINSNRKALEINPLIELKPILRSFDEKGWSNPKKLLDRLLEYKKELMNDVFSIKSLITKILDFLNLDGIISTVAIRDKIINYLKNEKDIVDFNDEVDIEDVLISVKDCLVEITDISSIIPKLKSYIKSQNILFDKEIDRICLIVDRDKESFISTPKNDQYGYVVKKCKENGIEFYITNPCFEFWLLLHFDEVCSVDKKSLLENPKVNSKIRYVEAELKKLVSGYRKNDIKFEFYLDRIENAIINQKNFCENVDDLKDNIGSNLASLICSFRDK